MSKDYFEFKQFTIYHDRCAMKVGTDGVLLGAWSDVSENIKEILDIGTGSGLISIMLAQRCGANITGIDIDEEAVAQAKENGRRTPWAQHLHFETVDALSYIPRTKFDLITCNPPFYTNSLPCSEQKRCLARHTDTLPFDLLVQKVYGWLNDGGFFNVILPASVTDYFVQESWAAGLNLYKKCMVYSRSDIPAKRCLISLRKGCTNYPQIDYLYILNEKGFYTEEYKKLTDSYYLNF